MVRGASAVLRYGIFGEVMTSQTIVIHRLALKGIEGPGQNRHQPTLPANFDAGAAVRIHDKLAQWRTAVKHCLINVNGHGNDGVSMILVTTSHSLVTEDIILADRELKVSFFDRDLVSERQTLEAQSDAEYAELSKLLSGAGERLVPRREALIQNELQMRASRSDYVFTVQSQSVTGRGLPPEPTTGRLAATATSDPSFALLKELASLLGQIAQLAYNSPPSF